MIPQAITLHNNFIIILSQYIIFLFWRDIFRTSSRLLISPLYLPKDYWIHSRRAKTQKIKRIDHRKRNARADKCNLLTEIPFEQAVVFWFLPLLPPTTIEYIPSGANKQKIKRIDHRKCNVRASKNAEQAFSTQRYLYISCGLFFLFSSVSSQWIK